MATTKRATRGKQAVYGGRQCAQPEEPERDFSPDITSGRARLIRVSSDKWTKGTVLHYHFLKSCAFSIFVRAGIV